MIRFAGVACIATAFFIAVFDLGRRSVLPDRPCVFCTKMLTPPLYQCDHYLGDGQATGPTPDVTWR
jgi:hypothetical protein